MKKNNIISLDQWKKPKEMTKSQKKLDAFVIDEIANNNTSFGHDFDDDYDEVLLTGILIW